MSENKIVSNLGIGVSRQWAQSRKVAEESKIFVSEAASITKHTQKDVTSPASFSELDLLLEIPKANTTWGTYEMPQGYNDQSRRIFTTHIAQLGSVDQLEDKIQRIQALQVAPGVEKDSRQASEKTSIIDAIRLLVRLDNDLTFALSRTCQYKKA